MMQINPHVEHVIKWRESMALIPEDNFFQVMRTYLGEIESPYNKQNIIERLGAFLRKEETRNAMILMLDNVDLQILSAINEIPEATTEKLISFFDKSYSPMELRKRLLNLEERLVIYSHDDEDGKNRIFEITPYLDDCLVNLVNKSILLPKAHCEQKENFDSYENKGLSTQLLTSFLCFIAENPEICKADMTFKKKATALIQDIFGKTQLLQLLLKAFLSLGLVNDKNGKLIIDFSKLEAFSILTDSFQDAFLCVGTLGHLTRNTLQQQAQLLLDVINTIPQEGYTRKSLNRAAYLINAVNSGKSRFNTFGTKGRFAQLLSKADEKEDSPQIKFDSLIDTAVTFGLIKINGIDDTGENVYVRVCKERTPYTQKMMSIDASFNVMCMPGLNLLESLPLIKIMDIKHFDTAASFELNRKSVMRAFDSRLNNFDVLRIIEEHSLYDIPQNVRISIDEWYQSYMSATLYKGYILKVNQDKCVLVEKNPAIAKHIKVVIAPGIYLLDFNDDEQAQQLFSKTGLDFVGNVNTVEQKQPSIGFPILHNGEAYLDERDYEQKDLIENNLTKNMHEKEDFQKQLFEQVENENLDSDQKREILSRIQRRIVINKNQLKGECIKIERLEAGSMDFYGKIHVIDNAINSKCMIEIEFDGKKITCTPISIEKQVGEAIASVVTSIGDMPHQIPVSRIIHVKRLPLSLFV